MSLLILLNKDVMSRDNKLIASEDWLQIRIDREPLLTEDVQYRTMMQWTFNANVISCNLWRGVHNVQPMSTL